MEKLEIYTKNTECWFKDEQECFKTGILTAKSLTSTEIVLEFKVGSKPILFKRTLKALEATGYDDLPLLCNPPRLQGTDDLTTLSYLHEAALLNSVKVRYAQETIYTYSGLVLIAMNPFRRLNIYTPEIMRQYAGRPRHELEPHLFAIAEEAYRKMIIDKQNQSIIVSGESGAGKTMSAKFVMRLE
jgi:myosin-5